MPYVSPYSGLSTIFSLYSEISMYHFWFFPQANQLSLRIFHATLRFDSFPPSPALDIFLILRFRAISLLDWQIANCTVLTSCWGVYFTQLWLCVQSPVHWFWYTSSFSWFFGYPLVTHRFSLDILAPAFSSCELSCYLSTSKMQYFG